MKEFSVYDATRACDGIYNGGEAVKGQMVKGVVIDNRKVEDGFLFVPIKGERFDGHDFIGAAYEAGAVCCLSEKKLETQKPYILVKDSLQAYQDIAEFYKGLFGVKMIGITGSVGKTTTKEMVASVLEQQFCVLKTEGNLNNQTGVPQNLLRLLPEHEVAVIEMGTNHFGEIRSLSKMARPDFCFLTNIGQAHIEHLGSREGILKAKSEMLEYMREDGRVFVNGDDEYLWTLKETRSDVTTFGIGTQNDIYTTDIREMGLEGSDFTAHFDGKEMAIHVPSPGRHMIYNALAAIAAGLALYMEPEKIARGIAGYTPISGRMCIEKANGLTVLNDAYNANPGSMKAAIDVLSYAKGRKVCVLGDMFELGDKAEEYHRQVGSYAAKKGIDEILCVGELAKGIYDGASERCGNASYFKTQNELLEKIEGHIHSGDTVLVKASRGMKLEKTVEYLLH